MVGLAALFWVVMALHAALVHEGCCDDAVARYDGATVDIDRMIDAGELSDATEALEALRRDWQPCMSEGPAGALRHDIYGRLVELHRRHSPVDARSPDELLEIVDEGLAADEHTLPPNPFTARLLSLRGDVLADLGRDEEALATYEEALEMNEILLQLATQEAV